MSTEKGESPLSDQAFCIRGLSIPTTSGDDRSKAFRPAEKLPAVESDENLRPTTILNSSATPYQTEYKPGFHIGEGRRGLL